jgi:hypothetical protein
VTEVFLNLTEVFLTLTEVFLNLTQVFLTLTEVFPCLFLNCKANARVKRRKDGARTALYHISLYLCSDIVLFGCYLCCSIYCLCVNVYCHRVTTHLQLINISYRCAAFVMCSIHLWRKGFLEYWCSTGKVFKVFRNLCL